MGGDGGDGGAGAIDADSIIAAIDIGEVEVLLVSWRQKEHMEVWGGEMRREGVLGIAILTYQT